MPQFVKPVLLLLLCLIISGCPHANSDPNASFYGTDLKGPNLGDKDGSLELDSSKAAALSCDQIKEKLKSYYLKMKLLELELSMSSQHRNVFFLPDAQAVRKPSLIERDKVLVHKSWNTLIRTASQKKCGMSWPKLGEVPIGAHDASSIIDSRATVFFIQDHLDKEKNKKISKNKPINPEARLGCKSLKIEIGYLYKQLESQQSRLKKAIKVDREKLDIFAKGLSKVGSTNQEMQKLISLTKQWNKYVIALWDQDCKEPYVVNPIVPGDPLPLVTMAVKAKRAKKFLDEYAVKLAEEKKKRQAKLAEEKRRKAAAKRERELAKRKQAQQQAELGLWEIGKSAIQQGKGTASRMKLRKGEGFSNVNLYVMNYIDAQLPDASILSKKIYGKICVSPGAMGRDLIKQMGEKPFATIHTFWFVAPKSGTYIFTSRLKNKKRSGNGTFIAKLQVKTGNGVAVLFDKTMDISAKSQKIVVPVKVEMEENGAYQLEVEFRGPSADCTEAELMVRIPGETVPKAIGPQYVWAELPK